MAARKDQVTVEILTNNSESTELVEITAKREAFAQECVRLRNKMAAYRKVYNVDPKSLPQSVYSIACRLSAEPEVAARIYTLQQQAAALALVDNALRIQELRDLESADPSDIISVLIRNCRYCHGTNYGYQWIDEDEYLTACIKAVDAKQPMPSNTGGYGYQRALEPNLICPQCLGVGTRDVWVADTRHLSGKAKLLYKGAKLKADGSIEILLHDQMQARDQLNKILGLYAKENGTGNTYIVNNNTAAAAAAVKEVAELTLEQVEREYLKLV